MSSRSHTPCPTATLSMTHCYSTLNVCWRWFGSQLRGHYETAIPQQNISCQMSRRGYIQKVDIFLHVQISDTIRRPTYNRFCKTHSRTSLKLSIITILIVAQWSPSTRIRCAVPGINVIGYSTQTLILRSKRDDLEKIRHIPR